MDLGASGLAVGQRRSLDLGRFVADLVQRRARAHLGQEFGLCAGISRGGVGDGRGLLGRDLTAACRVVQRRLVLETLGGVDRVAGIADGGPGFPGDQIGGRCGAGAAMDLGLRDSRRAQRRERGGDVLGVGGDGFLDLGEPHQRTFRRESTSRGEVNPEAVTNYSDTIISNRCSRCKSFEENLVFFSRHVGGVASSRPSAAARAPAFRTSLRVHRPHHR